MTDAVTERKTHALYRMGAVVLLLILLWAVGYAFGLQDLDRVQLQEQMKQAGWIGFGLFLVAFAVGELLHVPGVLFVLAAITVYDGWFGTLASLLGGTLSVVITFVIVRKVGGTALSEVHRPFVMRLLEHLDRHPISTVIVLRVLFWMGPTLNYALALSRIRFIDYVIGSFLGLIPPIVAVAFFYDRVVQWLG